MKWIKRGQFFDPDDTLPAGCVGSPSRRKRSCATIACASILDPSAGRERPVREPYGLRRYEQTSAVLRSRTPVLSLGGLGCFDEHGIFPINVVAHGERSSPTRADGAGARPCPWKPPSGSPRAMTAARPSSVPGPGRSSARRRTSRASSAIPSCCRRGALAHVVHLRHPLATACLRARPRLQDRSCDLAGRRRVGSTRVADRRRCLGDDECQALPTVIEIDGSYHMFFCYRHVLRFPDQRDRGYRIGHAWSDDLENWTRDDTTCRWIRRQATGTPTCTATRTCSSATVACTCSTTATSSAATGSGLAVLER